MIDIREPGTELPSTPGNSFPLIDYSSSPGLHDVDEGMEIDEEDTGGFGPKGGLLFNIPSQADLQALMVNEVEPDLFSMTTLMEHNLKSPARYPISISPLPTPEKMTRHSRKSLSMEKSLSNKHSKKPRTTKEALGTSLSPSIEGQSAEEKFACYLLKDS